MKAEHTVIELKQLTEVRTAYPANDVSRAQMVADQKKIKEQAGISFKAGYNQGVMDSGAIKRKHIKAHGDICYQAGRKEVVDWGNEKCPHITSHFAIKRSCDRCWQAQLKSWGIKED